MEHGIGATATSLITIGPSQLMVDYAETYVDRLLLIDLPERISSFNVNPRITMIRSLDYLECDFDTLATCIRAFISEGSNERCYGIFALTDRALLLQAQLNALFGYIDNPVSAVEAMVTKSHMRALLNEHTEFVTQAVTVTSPVEAREACESFDSPFPCVAKPIVGRGSLGVYLIRTASEFDSLDYPLLLEEYIEGQEYSVEGILCDGEYHCFGVTLKEKGVLGQPDELAEFGHLHPAPLDQDTYQLIEKAVGTALHAIGQRSGLSHTEVFVTPTRQVRIVETHARNGGQHINDIVRLAHGVDMVECALKQRLEILEDKDIKPTVKSRYAGVRYFPNESGRISRVSGLERTRFTQGIHSIELFYQPGDTFIAGVGSGEQIGCIVASAESFNDLDTHLRRAMGEVHISIDAGKAGEHGS